MFNLLYYAVVCEQDDIRLQGGNDDRSGRVEICNDNAWGTICNNLWDNVDADVACGQLGYVEEGAIVSFVDLLAS